MPSAGRYLFTAASSLATLALSYDPDAWNRALQAHVSLGELEGIPTHVVDYASMAADPDFLTFVSSLDNANTSSLNKNETYALFMNAYNALAVRMIIDHPCKHSVLGKCTGPISSIRDIGSVTSPVWNKPAGKIGGKMYSLQEVEDFLRNPGSLGEDSRLHSCIVCASISCPNLRSEAFMAQTIDEQMTAQMMNMLNNTKKGMLVDRATGQITLSMIFKWYAADFSKAAGSVIDFILPYVPNADDKAYIADHKASLQLKYFEYDWDANGKPPCQCVASEVPVHV